MKRLHLTLLPLLVAGLVWGAEAPAPLPLTHRQALLLGASNLLQARIAREIREQIRQFPEAERGAFDWQLSASASNGKLAFGEVNPRFSGLANLYLTALNTTEETRTASLGISKLDAIGGTTR
jgi:biotin carboxylase